MQICFFLFFTAFWNFWRITRLSNTNHRWVINAQTGPIVFLAHPVDKGVGVGRMQNRLHLILTFQPVALETLGPIKFTEDLGSNISTIIIMRKERLSLFPRLLV